MRRLLVLPIIAAIGFVALPAGSAERSSESELEVHPLTLSVDSGTPTDEVDVDTDDVGIVGLRWDGDEAAEFRVLVLGNDGEWSELDHVEVSDDGPDPGSAEDLAAQERRGSEHVSDAVMVDVPSKVRVEVLEGDVADVEILTVTTPEVDITSTGVERAGAVPRTIAIVTLACLAVALLLPANRRRLASTASVMTVVIAMSFLAVACNPPATPSSQPAITTRAQWGARAPQCSFSASPNLYQAVIHHTAGSNSYTAAQSPGVVKGIQNFHMDGNGWCDIGYNFLVDRFGKTFEGRYNSINLATTGAHAAGYNTSSVGVAVMGNFTGTTPTQASVDAVVRVITWKFSKHGTNPYQAIHRAGKWTDSIIGHRDANSTSCPGTYLYSRLGEIRSRVKPSVTKPLPFGNFESATSEGNQVRIQGWVIDPAFPSTPANVHIYVGGPYGVGKGVYFGPANVPRPDVATAYPGYGTNRGFNVLAPKYGPNNQVCVYISAGPGRSPAMGCRSF